MKRSFLLGLVVCLAGAACANQEPAAVEDTPTTLASPSPSPSPSPTNPVQLEGLVNNMGVRDFTGVGSDIAVEFQLSDFAFSPTFIKVMPGSTVRFSLDNVGQARHTFTIDSLRVDHELEAGGQNEGQFQLPESGVVPFYCRLHVGRGMQGAFYFQEGDSALAAAPELSDDTDGSSGGTRSTGTSSRRTGTVRRAATSNQAPAGSQTAQNREGDLVVPDVVIGEEQQGGSLGASPRAFQSPGQSSSQGGQASNNNAGQVTAPGSTAKEGEPSQPGTDGGTGEQGADGGRGEPGKSASGEED